MSAITQGVAKKCDSLARRQALFQQLQRLPAQSLPSVRLIGLTASNTGEFKDRHEHCHDDATNDNPQEADKQRLHERSQGFD